MSDYKKIVLATDFSDVSSLAAQRARTLAQQSGTELTVLHVVSYVPPAYIGVEMPAEYSSKKYLTDRAAEHLEEWAKGNNLQAARLVTESGPAKRTIIDACKKLGADLVVLGAHGETGLARVFGSVANAVAHHSECDVLIVRPRK
jgi:universal stress protein A